jgi:hypothetical protein
MILKVLLNPNIIVQRAIDQKKASWFYNSHDVLFCKETYKITFSFNFAIISFYKWNIINGFGFDILSKPS